MEPADADAYFGKALRASPSGTRLARSQPLTTHSAYPELRHRAELHRLTVRIIACPVDEVNRPRDAKDARLRISPPEAETGQLFTGWAGELATCRKFAPDGPQLHCLEADVRAGAAAERSPQAGPG
ncbi:hypothetical protein [Streptomyces chrestomyceticus]|uniref:hypothetical protein n=1 Tax=Streptomyces chrestomyceticus TaxID=68185 RepID=UPI0033C8E103